MAQVTQIPVQFDIWDTYYTITDHGDWMVVEIPCREYEDKRDCNNWGLGSYTEKVTDDKTIELLRKIAENNQIALYPKNGQPVAFEIVEIIAGIPQSNGWMVDDFE
ncbi:hypothetical protein [Aggregatibacter kilianii]|uniref:hypothetical protein n=1 Tax=Aggregatibacter kilianii TaxID=2025884 RepID=UPI000D6461F0|nr:hypothetical protein [Aggregatibacter kilianii]